MPSLPFANALKPAAQLLKQLATVQAREPKISIGVDIGATSVKAIALGARKGTGPRPIIGQRLVPLDESKAGSDVSAAMKAAVEAMNVPVPPVNLAVSGQWVIMRIVEMPTMKPAEMKQALPFEAQRYLPFNVQEVTIDGVALGPSDASKTWVLIVACKKELIERRLDAARGAGCEVALIDVDALALANAFLAGFNGQGSSGGTQALIDVGAQLTNLVIFRNGTPYLVRDIPWGGEKLIRGAVEHAGVEAGAVASALIQGELSPQLMAAVASASETLVTELQLSFDYFENRFGQPPDQLLVSGGLSQSAGFIEAVKSHLTQGVNLWTPVEGLSGQFAVAYGLALRTN